MNQSNLSIDCLSVQKCSTLNSLKKSSDTPPVVGTSSHKTSDTNAVYIKEKRYIEDHVQSVTTEQANRSIAQILHTVVSNDQKNWSNKCPMVEFAINSSINATMGYAPFELNHGYIPRSGQHISTDTTFKGVKQFAQQAVWNLLDAHDAILEHRIEQTHHSNKCCKPSIEYQIDDLVYLLTKNLALPKHRA